MVFARFAARLNSLVKKSECKANSPQDQLAGAKALIISLAFCGLTEVRPFYKALSIEFFTKL